MNDYPLTRIALALKSSPDDWVECRLVEYNLTTEIVTYWPMGDAEPKLIAASAVSAMETETKLG